MSLSREQKTTIVAELKELSQTAQSVVIAEYRGIDVSSVTELRKQARAAGVTLRVLKNTLVKRALEDTVYGCLADQLKGPLIYAFSEDPVSSAKVLSEFAKKEQKLVIVGGAMPNYPMNAQGVQALASMPSREELLAKLLGTMQAPISKFVRTLNEVPTSFVRALAAVKEQKEGQSS